MNKEQLVENIKKKNSFLCVGLDTDIKLIPKHMLEFDDPVFEFNKNIIDATKDYTVAYKPNTAFYESCGAEGWESLEKTIQYINSTCPDIFTIADAKRGDIGNTSKMYADAFFNKLNFDSVTVAPYMGEDSVTPFLEFKGKWVILLALTSNKGAFDFQTLQIDNEFVFERVLKKSKEWGNDENMMYVVGATKAEKLKEVREIVPDNFLLVPGVGAQGGSLSEVAKFGMNSQCGLLVNSSRGVIYAGNGEDFAEAAMLEAKKLQEEMNILLNQYM